MEPLTAGVFALPKRLAAKAAPELISDDERHFAAIAQTVRASIADISARLDAARKEPGGTGQAAMDRDLGVRRLAARLNTLRRFGLDLCLGRMVGNDGAPVYVGRLGLTDNDGRQLLIDWRSPAAEPFFGATHANAMGLISRRRYRWTGERITDYWDEVFTPEGLETRAALDDQSAFIASLGADRTSRMRDVLATIQADQDAIIRAPSRGALVVDGGPGTGKTVVALHRSAYLLYSDPRLSRSRGGVLFVGPHQPYLAYVADILPGLGEDGVETCTLRDFVAEGATAAIEPAAEVAALKSSVRMMSVIEPAVALFEEPPTDDLRVETPWADLWLTAGDWAEAFAAPETGTTHNDARDVVWEALLDILIEQAGHVAPPHQVRRALRQNYDLTSRFTKAWPLLEASHVVAELWSTPAYLRRCAPWLSTEERKALERADAAPWTLADLPLLDAARQRIGDPEASARRRREETVLARQREQMSAVIDDLLEAQTHDDGEGVMSMLQVEDARNSLINVAETAPHDVDVLAGPFAHIVVDEAQELTDAEWQMLLSRCPSRSFTVVGDRAQARHGFTESWEERLHRVGIERMTLASLTVNYRTPAEIMAAAEPVIRAALPDANVPTSVRSTGVAVERGGVADRDAILTDWLATHDDGVACVINDPTFTATDRIRSLTPELAKGLEFDLVVLVDPNSFGAGVTGAVDRYVAMTRATQRLVILDPVG